MKDISCFFFKHLSVVVGVWKSFFDLNHLYEV